MPQNHSAPIVFNEDDGALFSLDDAQLKADVLKNDVLPRLGQVLERTLDRVQQIYGIELLELSTVASTPAFRPNRRMEPVKLHYSAATQGLTGKRSLVWKGIKRPDGEPAKIAPHRLVFVLDQDGMYVELYHWWKQYTPSTNRKFVRFILEHHDQIFQLMRLAQLDLIAPLGDVFSLKEDLLYEASEGGSPTFSSRPQTFPVRGARLRHLMEQYVLLYPIYDSYLRIAMGKRPRFSQLMGKLQRHYQKHEEQIHPGVEARRDPTKPLDIKKVMRNADKRAMVALGWRMKVFLHDNFTCQACSRNRFVHGAVLHVDHIIPRSKGGSNEMSNYQTLCDKCNLSKSNKDSTDLRALGRRMRGEDV